MAFFAVFLAVLFVYALICVMSFTGSYIFNGLLSGSIYGGLPANKITALAGESATGKTYFLMGIVKNFLDMDKESGVIYFESESAISKEMIESRGIDSSRMAILPITTVQEFRSVSYTHLTLPTKA